MNQFETDVLIVGAGPSGLMMANQLQKFGVKFKLIDQKLEPSQYSKALVVHSRSLEMMDLLGISDLFLKEGYINKYIHFFSNRHELFSIDFSSMNRTTDFPFMCIIPQSHTEHILEGQLPQDFVERETQLVDLEQHNDYVKATVQNGVQQQEVTAKYVIGCDGAHSATRDLLNMPFEGESENVGVLLGDVKVDDPSLNTKLSLISGENGLLFFAPFKDEYTRVIVIDYSKQGDLFPVEVTLRDLQDSVGRVYNKQLELSDPYWLSSFTASHRQVPSYRDRRVFLVGDAAHIHNPIGGQGMNVGLQDAVNLSWKLAYVLQHKVSKELLDTYDSERRPVAREVIKRTVFMIQAMTIQNKYGIRARNKALQLAAYNKSFRTRVPTNMSQLLVNYTGTDIARSISASSGQRVPNLHFFTLDKEETDLYSHLRSGQCILLISTHKGALNQVQQEITKAVDVFNIKCGSLLKPLFIVQDDLHDKNRKDNSIVLDLYGHSKERVNLQTGEVMVVRPDSYVMFHNQISNGQGLTKALLNYFGKSTH